jgi:hypothetical protein
MRRRFAVLAVAGCVLAAEPPAAPAATAHELRRYPYLTDATTGGVTVNWGTDRTMTSGSVRWGRAGTESCTAHTATATRSSIIVGAEPNAEPQYHWAARIDTGDGTRFCYRVFGGATDLLATDDSPLAVSALPAGSPEPFSFAVLGDWGQGYAAGNPDQAAVMRQIAASGARFAVSTGDIGYQGGTPTNYGDLVATGENVSGVFGPDGWTLPGRSIPHFTTAGNHGFNRTFLSMWPTTETAAASGGRWEMETYCCTNGTTSASYPSAWYAFDQGKARFYVLEAAWHEVNNGTASAYQNDYDNHWTPSSPEYQWLEADLAAHPGAVKLAFWHYPLYVDNPTETSDPFLQGAGSLEGLLNRHGVDLGFTGHAHVYQRNLAAPGGLVTYVTGGAGARPQPVHGCTAIDAYAIGWANTTSTGSACGAAPRPTSKAQVHHFLHVTVDGTRVTVAPTDSTGRAFDVQTYDFSPTAVTPPGGGTPGTDRGAGSGGAGGGGGTTVGTRCMPRLRGVPQARTRRVRGIGRVTLAVRPTVSAASARLVVKARRANVRRVLFTLDGRALRGARRGLTRKLNVAGIGAGRHVLQVRVTPKRGKARTLKLALRVAAC